MFYDEYLNGYIQRDAKGRYVGEIRIDGILLTPIEAMFFDEDGEKHIWLKRPPIKEYDFETSSFNVRKPKPYWEAYLDKTTDEGNVCYKGVFMFMRFRYSIKGVWDATFGKDKNRLNLFVERLPISNQNILLSINERKKKEKHERRQDE